MMEAESHAHVLLIEDDPALGAVTTEVLTHLGHDVAWLHSADAAFASLSQDHHFDVVVLDLGLGANDGVTLIKTLREQGRVVPPVLVFSAQPVDVLRQAAGAIGAAAIVQKPCTSRELADALKKTLRRSA